MKITTEITKSTEGYTIMLIDWIFMGDIDLEEQQSVSEKLGEIIGIAEQHKLAFRVYRTAGGLRPICVSNFFRSKAGASQRILGDLGCDPRYAACIKKEGYFFGGRISPKPSRIGMESKGFVFYNLLPHEQKDWIEEYNIKSKGFKACDFILQTSECEIPSQIQNFIRLHDERSGCHLDLPLA